MRIKMETVNEPPLISAKKFWEPYRWAVVGASGFIGKNIVQQLKTAGIDVLQVSAPRVFLEVGFDPVQNILKVSENHPAVDLLADQFKGIDVVINAAGVAAPGGAGGNTIYGANSLLPTIIATASAKVGVGRLVHLSSAAVQGRQKVLDSSAAVSPFSHYSYSKALGERALLAVMKSNAEIDISIIRATSVQGLDRPTTEKLQCIAKSRLASVASPGTQPSVVSSVTSLCEFIQTVGEYKEKMSVIQVQPWEGLNVCDVLTLAGNREPTVLPSVVCQIFVGMGHLVGRAIPPVAGITRRVEMMWFGQDLNATKYQIPYRASPAAIRSIFREGLEKE